MGILPVALTQLAQSVRHEVDGTSTGTFPLGAHAVVRDLLQLPHLARVTGAMGVLSNPILADYPTVHRA